MATKFMDKVTLTNGHDLWFALYGSPNALHTYVLIHGSPGSHEDFKELSPLLLSDDFNVIALDLPGSGLTSSEAAGGENLSEELLVDATREFIQILALRDPRRRFILLGHSFGGGTAMQVAAKGKFESLLGICLINSSGFRPQAGLNPYWINYFLFQLLILSPVTRFFMVPIVYFVMIKIIGLSPTLSKPQAVWMFHHAGTMDFPHVKECELSIKEQKIPVFHASARNDRLVEKAIGDEICALLQPAVRIEYDRGGHNIHRTRAPELGEAITKWATTISASQGDTQKASL
ncbi:hypothetical protein LEN26_011353 [Aphanomyces euteiches]|nr:hypothetical protein AeMF1_017954 [Aphanomyces euteiches]KAH9119951.1 hypothetical protein LEN26_011353 [Aphanomyces euteiches]KAH9189664.1 hypothetical protein AeNC1_008365 [Aphanomyces euteiches]